MHEIKYASNQNQRRFSQIHFLTSLSPGASTFLALVKLVHSGASCAVNISQYYKSFFGVSIKNMIYHPLPARRTCGDEPVHHFTCRSSQSNIDKSSRTCDLMSFCSLPGLLPLLRPKALSGILQPKQAQPFWRPCKFMFNFLCTVQETFDLTGTCPAQLYIFFIMWCKSSLHFASSACSWSSMLQTKSITSSKAWLMMWIEWQQIHATDACIKGALSKVSKGEELSSSWLLLAL